ncbi:MAG: hypothetical protein ACP5MZ_04475 [Candidatus Micrarchaeia archaeon]
MKLQAFVDIEVSLAICLLFAVLLSGAYIGAYRYMDSHTQGLAHSVNAVERAVSGYLGQHSEA